MQHRSRIAGLAAITTVFGLGTALLDAQTPAQERVYQLASVDGQALPLAAEEEDGCREEVTAATLTLVDATTWRLEVAERETCGDAVEEETDTDEGTYTTEGDALRFTESDDEPDEADDDESDESDESDEEDPDDAELDLEDLGPGALSADGLTIQLEGGRTALFHPRAG